MASVAPNFRYNVDDEPTEDWTIEELMQWCLLRAHKETEDAHDTMIESLNRQMQEGSNEIWKHHQEVIQDAAQPEDCNTENVAPTTNKNATSATKTVAPVKNTKSASITSINVTVTEGKYAGKTFQLKPTKRAPCWVGRSAGKKFRERGISLPEDPEVSTTHGKFEIKGDKAFFTDTGSTNGTLYKEEELEDNVPLELSDGMVLQVGGSVMSISLG